MENNLELSFPQGFNMEALDKHGTLFGNFDFHSLKQEPVNYQQYLNLQPDDDYPSNFSLLDSQLYLESNYPAKIGQEESISRTTASCNNSSQEFEKIPEEKIEKMLQKARRQMYRERAKQRKLQKDTMKEENTLPIKEEISVQIKLEESIQCQPFLSDPKEQRKQQQQLRNRISAQQSRDKRKQYLSQLELKQEFLEQKIKQLEQENEQLKEKAPCPKQLFVKDAAKIGFIMFSLMALVCSVQAKKHGIDEGETIVAKEITFMNDKEKKLINESQEIMIEENQAMKDVSEINLTDEFQENSRNKVKQKKISNKTIRKQKKKRENRKNK